MAASYRKEMKWQSQADIARVYRKCLAAKAYVASRSGVLLGITRAWRPIYLTAYLAIRGRAE